MKLQAAARLQASMVSVTVSKGASPKDDRVMQKLIEKFDGVVQLRPKNAGGQGEWKIEFQSRGDAVGFTHEMENTLPSFHHAR